MSNNSSSCPELDDLLARLGLGFGLGGAGVEWSCGIRGKGTDFPFRLPDVRLAAGTRFAAVCFDAIEKEKKGIAVK